MLYITPNLCGVIRLRLLVVRVITTRSLNYMTNSQAHGIVSRICFPGLKFTSQFQNYATKSKYDENRIPEILKKLSSNKISLQFDEFTRVRPRLFKNYNITVENGFNILKSCSQLLDRSADERIKLVNECWSELVHMIKTPTKDHLILLLQAYRRAGLCSLDNYQSFFEKYKCPIDADIYAELMYIACQNGETMANAEALLKDIKDHDVPLDDRFYNALIMGYSKQGLDAVENVHTTLFKVLETMKSGKITPTLYTQAELIKSYINNGYNDKAMEILQKTTEFNTELLFDIIRCAVTDKGAEQIVEKALSLLPKTILFAKLIEQNLQNICTEIVHANQKRSVDYKLDPYLLIIQHLPVPRYDIDDTNEYGTFLIKEMIVTNESVSNILQFCENLIESERNIYAIHVCCMYSLIFKLPTARDFLEALAAREPLRPHYFWPLFCEAKNQNEVIDVVIFANKLNTVLDSATLLKWVLPRTNTLINSQETVNALIEANVRMFELKTATIAYLLSNKRPKEALGIASRSTASIDPFILQPALKDFIRSKWYTSNASTTTILIKKLQSRCRDKQHDLAGQVVLLICDKRDQINGFVITKKLITDFQKQKLNISSASANEIINRISKDRKVFLELSPIVESLICNEMFPVAASTQSTEKSESEVIELEKQLIEYKANGLPIHGVLYRLFCKHVQYDQFDQALAIKKECDKFGVIETRAMLSTLLKLWTATKNEEKAMQVLTTLQRQHPQFKIDSYKIINLATLLLSKNRFEDAKKLIDKLGSCKDRQLVLQTTKNVWNLLDAACEYSLKHCIENNIAGQLLTIMVNKGYCNYSNQLLGCVIKEYIDKKQIHDAVASFEYFVNEYKKTPQSVSLLTLLIEIAKGGTEYNVSKQEAIEYLQRVIELIQEVHGTENSNVNLILAFASAGHEQQLRKILMDPNVKFNSNMLIKSLSYLKEHSKVKVVVAVARCARGLSHESLKEEVLYEFILNDFVGKNDFTSAVQLYEEIQQNESIVSKKFRNTLFELLKKNNQPLPEKLRASFY